MIEYLQQNFNWFSFFLGVAAYVLFSSALNLAVSYITLRRAKQRVKESEKELEKMQKQLKDKDRELEQILSQKGEDK